MFGGLSIPPGVNDSQALLKTLAEGCVPDVFNCLRGPWAAVYWQAATRTLWFGRDVLGRTLCCRIACLPLEQRDHRKSSDIPRWQKVHVFLKWWLCYVCISSIRLLMSCALFLCLCASNNAITHTKGSCCRHDCRQHLTTPLNSSFLVSVGTTQQFLWGQHNRCVCCFCWEFLASMCAW